MSDNARSEKEKKNTNNKTKQRRQQLTVTWKMWFFHQGFLYFVLAVINGNSFKQYHDFYRMSLTAQMILFRRELRKIVIHLNNKATNK